MKGYLFTYLLMWLTTGVRKSEERQ